MKRLILAVLLALVAAACAAPAGVGDAGPVTTRPPATGPDREPTTTTTTTTTTPQEAEEPKDGTTTTPPAGGETVDLAVYFLLDETEERSHRAGPFLVPVHRRVDHTVAVAGAAMAELLAGPTAAESAGRPAISTAVPPETLLLGINVVNGLATVDLSREFESGGGTFSMTARLAQVVYTLTQFTTIDRVEFRLDGTPVEVFSSEGILLEEPVSRDDYLDVLPLIFVDRPRWGGPAGNPARVVGRAAVFEATFQWALVDGEGIILEEGFAMTSEGQGWGDFDFTIPYSVDAEQLGALVVWSESAEDGRRQDIREHPVWLTPAR